MGGLLDNSSNMPEPAALSSAYSEYNEAWFICQSIQHPHTNLIELYQLENGVNAYVPAYIQWDNKSVVDTSATFKVTKHLRCILRRWQDVWAYVIPLTR
jgi:hypothetical protein